MAALCGHDGRDMTMMGTSESQQRCRFKRKRRRRCQSKGRSNGLSTIINPMRHRDVGMTSAEEGHNTSPSGVEVKENQDHRNQVDCEVPAMHRLAGCLCTTLPKGGTRALKRKQPLVDGKDRLLDQNQPKRACKRTAWAVSPKNALVQLNELRPGLRYEITSKTGPLHAPVFSIGVEVNGLWFEGRGTTKKQAKMRAAELALRSFVQFPNASQAHLAMGNLTGGHPTDFTADRLDVSPHAFLNEFEPSSLRERRDRMHLKPGRTTECKRGQLVRLKFQDLLSSASLKRHLVGASLSEQLGGPVALLNKLHPGLRYVCLTERLQGRPAARCSFVMVVRAMGQIFEGSGHSKTLAKAQAAAAALQALYHVSLAMDRRLLGHAATGRDKSQLPQGFAEAIFHLVREKYRQLTDSCCATSQARHHKVLAGIVMTRGFDLHEAQVVALGSGTRCLSGDAVSHHGSTLNDCHAEVIARRALVRFLYSQLELVLCKQADDLDQSIFIPNKASGYRLRDGVLFHMFVSSSPCGDARLNCPYELTATNTSSHRLVRKFHCHLRMKTGGGEGTLPVTAAPRANQKCDAGALPGRPRVTMSCTDKIARWSVAGLQGALLAGLVEPVYLCSLTVGTLCHGGHLARAMARRLAHVGRLPFPYQRNRMLLGCLSSGEARPSGGRSPALSGNWSCGDRGLEEVSTATGRRADSGMPSRLCKCSLFARWQRLKVNRGASDTEDRTAIRTYSGSKMASCSYQRVRQQFAIALRDGGLGVWTRKPTELDQFTVTV